MSFGGGRLDTRCVWSVWAENEKLHVETIYKPSSVQRNSSIPQASAASAMIFSSCSAGSSPGVSDALQKMPRLLLLQALLLCRSTSPYRSWYRWNPIRHSPRDVQRASKQRTAVGKDAFGSRAHDMVELVTLLAESLTSIVCEQSESMARAEKWQAACSFLDPIAQSLMI